MPTKEESLSGQLGRLYLVNPDGSRSLLCCTDRLEAESLPSSTSSSDSSKDITPTSMLRNWGPVEMTLHLKPSRAIRWLLSSMMATSRESKITQNSTRWLVMNRWRSMRNTSRSERHASTHSFSWGRIVRSRSQRPNQESSED